MTVTVVRPEVAQMARWLTHHRLTADDYRRAVELSAPYRNAQSYPAYVATNLRKMALRKSSHPVVPAGGNGQENRHTTAEAPA